MMKFLLSGLVSALVGSFFSIAPPLEAQDSAVETARAYRLEHGARILAEYAELLSLPNVASDTVNIRRNAEALRDELEERGIEAEIWSLPGAAPAVFGELEVEGAERTLGIYVHYDGQPVDPARWSHDPWTPTLTSKSLEDGGEVVPWPRKGQEIDPEWRIYARSAGDDKAPFPALFTALDALHEAGIAPTSNFKFLFEGEEEAGSPNLERYFEAHREDLQADLWLICDGPVHQSRRPQLVFGVRGYTGIDLTLYGAQRNLHSGHYGNWAPNPAMELARLLAGMKAPDGRVLIDGFYDSTTPPGPADLAAIADLPDSDDALRRELGLAATEMANAPLAERILLPSLNVRGLQAAAVGEKARNLIPKEAHASLDIRLAAGNDPEKMLDLVEAHLRRQGYHIVREEPDLATRRTYPRIVFSTRRPGYPAVRTPVGSEVVQPIVGAARRAAGEDPILLPTLGGSLPLYLFTQELGNPVVIVPIANHDNNQHAPDENLRLANLWYGIDLMAALLTLSSTGK